MMRRSTLISIAAAAALTAPALAQNYPVKPVRVIIPFAAGGGLDIALRPLLQKMSESLQQQFVMDIRAGANAPRTR
jgi:tripartite-type tricarboxylate transporter receptor subunit TctC